MKLFNSVCEYFRRISWSTLSKSCKEVIWLTGIAILPLLFNILILWVDKKNLSDAIQARIAPGEILAYCLSFLAPSLYLLPKTHGTGYKIPFVQLFSFTSIGIYICCLLLYLIAKNSWVKEINMNTSISGLYFQLAITFFLTTIIYRVFSLYHSKAESKWAEDRKQQQEDFNEDFKNSLN